MHLPLGETIDEDVDRRDEERIIDYSQYSRRHQSLSTNRLN